MMANAKIIAAALALVIFGSISAQGQDAAQPVTAPTKKFRRSKLTRDEAEGKADRRHVTLATGEDKIIDLDFDVLGEKFISIGNPQVVFVQVVSVSGSRKQLVFKPLKAGETNVVIRDEEGAVKLIFRTVIAGSNLLTRAAEIRRLLQDIEGIDIKIVGQKIVIDGEMLVPNDYGRLISVITDKVYSDLVLNLSTISPLALQAIARRIDQEIKGFAPNAEAKVVNNVIFLQGTVDKPEDVRRAGEIAKLYLPEVRPGNALERDPTAKIIPGRGLVQNFLLILPPPPKKQEKLVRVTVHFVELAKDYNRVFGFKWEPGFTAAPEIQIGQSGDGGVAGDGAAAAFTATLSNLLPRLQSAQSAGFARILKTGTILTRSGKPAQIQEGTQFSVVSLSAQGQPVAQPPTNVGLTLSVTPLIVGSSEDIEMDLDLSQVNLVGRAPAAGAPPTTAQHKVVTKIYVKNNESAAVVGVTSGEVVTQFNRDDPASGGFADGTTPLFSLLRSKQYAKKKSQFVVFVTPQIIENASEGTEDLKRNFRVKVK